VEVPTVVIEELVADLELWSAADACCWDKGAGPRGSGVPGRFGRGCPVSASVNRAGLRPLGAAP
jgi:hypothetical protein